MNTNTSNTPKLLSGKVTEQHIKIGQVIWKAGYAKDSLVPVPVRIISDFDNDRQCIQAEYVYKKDIPDYLEENIINIFLRDRGVRPLNYDNRCTQLFLSKEDMQAAIDVWGDRHPNFLEEDTFIKF